MQAVQTRVQDPIDRAAAAADRRDEETAGARREIVSAFTALPGKSSLAAVYVPATNLANDRVVGVPMDEAISQVLQEDRPLAAFHAVLLGADADLPSLCRVLRASLGYAWADAHADEVGEVRAGSWA